MLTVFAATGDLVYLFLLQHRPGFYVLCLDCECSDKISAAPVVKIF
jgi:hypothetical protein